MSTIIGYTEQPVYETEIRHYCAVELTGEAVRLTFLVWGLLRDTLPPEGIRAAMEHRGEHGSLPPGVKARVQEIPLSTIKGVRLTESGIRFDPASSGGLFGGLKRVLTSKGVEFEASERASFQALAEQVRARIGDASTG